MNEKTNADGHKLTFFPMPDEVMKKLRELINAITDVEIKEALLRILAKNDFNLLLRNAVKRAQIDLVRFLLAEVPTVNVNSCGSTSGQTALHIACTEGHLDIVKLLLENKAFVNAMDAQCYCPVVLAQLNERFEVMEYLVSKGGKRLLTSHDANIQISLKGRPQQEQACIRRIVQKLDQVDAELASKPSIQKTFLLEYILRENLATLKREQTKNRSDQPPKLESLPIPLLEFLRKHNIPLLTRETVLKSNDEYKDLPFNEMTSLLAKELPNDESVVLPLPLASYSATTEMIAQFESIPDELSQVFQLSVHTNEGVKVRHTAPLLRWELSFDTRCITKEIIKDFSKKVGAAMVIEKDRVKINFTQIDQNLITHFKNLITELLSTTKDNTQQPK